MEHRDLRRPFGRQLEKARERLQALIESAEKPVSEQQQQQQQHLLRQVLQELSETFEEVYVSSAELHAAETQLEIQQQNYRALFDLAPDAYFVTDVAGTIQQANRNAGILLGVRDEFLLGKPIALFFPPEHRPQYRRMMLNLARH